MVPLQYQAVDGGLRDSHPYVREAAVMGVLKCHDKDPGELFLLSFPLCICGI